MNSFPRRYNHWLASAGLGILLAGCGSAASSEREAVSPSQVSAADRAMVDLDGLMSQCWTPESRREKLLIKADPNQDIFFNPDLFRAYNYLILHGEQFDEEPCFAGFGFFSILPIHKKLITT